MRNRLVLLLTALLALQLCGCALRVTEHTPTETPSVASLESMEPVPTEPTVARVPSEPIATLAPTEPTEAPTKAITAPPTEAPEPFVYCGLVDLSSIDDSIIIEQKYATTDNFTGIQQYDRTLCLVHEDIAPMLAQANELAKTYGLRLKIWDAYRPISVQQALHDSVPPELSAYAPAPSPYSMHARGITVDVTLCDANGCELDMPTDFDDFTASAHSDYSGASETEIANRELLNEIMSTAGFRRSALEWWHFDGPNRDSYEILDVSFAEYETARDERC